jgi:predicted HicB family RNase H-like nuclease
MTKPKRDRKSKSLMVRFTPAQYRELQRAAKGSDSLAAWVRVVLMEATKTRDGVIR